MAISGKQVSDLMKQHKIVFMCAACEHMHKAIESGTPQCAHSGECGSPLSGRGFSKYSGPVSDFYRETICWACGEEGDFQIRLVEYGITLGCCDKHKDLNANLTSKLIVPGPRKKSLLETLEDL